MSLDARFATLLLEVNRLLPRLRDRSTEAVHDARVATRRLRAMLTLYEALSPQRDYADARQALRRFGRGLGRVRDVDVALALAAEVETRAPVFAPPLAVIRPRLVREATVRRRKLIKKLERLSLRPLERIAQDRRGRGTSRGHFRAVLAPALAAQACAVHDAIERGTGVYFPHRTHDTRIELRSLRYLLELAEGGEAQRKGVKLLKTSQEALGQIHDREVLLTWLEREAGEKGEPSAAALVETLEAEARTMYEVYANSRFEVLALCAAVSRSAASMAHPVRDRVLAIGAAAVAPAAFALFAGIARRRVESDREQAELEAADEQGQARGADRAQPELVAAVPWR